jgi:adenosylmethionine-8-amino-7-oxononanoate aminotransferase
MGWIMAKHMYKQVLLKTMTTIQTSRFLLVTCDEVMTTFGQCIMNINTCICC